MYTVWFLKRGIHLYVKYEFHKVYLEELIKKSCMLENYYVFAVKAFRYIQWIFNVVEKSVFNTDS
jgi:hypothetical protein